MYLNIEDKKTGENISLDVKSYYYDEFFTVLQYVNNINDFKFNINFNESEG